MTILGHFRLLTRSSRLKSTAFFGFQMFMFEWFNCKINLKEIELQSQLAVMRHCELVKVYKEGDRIYLVPFR